MALPVVVTLNTDVMAFMQMQIWPSDDVVDLSFIAQNSHDSNRLISEHSVLGEFNEFTRGIFCPPFLNTSFDCAFEKPRQLPDRQPSKSGCKGPAERA